MLSFISFCVQLNQLIVNQLNTLSALHFSKQFGWHMIEFGSRLRHLRQNHNMTQPALAKRLQVTKSVISAYETGLRMPSYETLLMISKVFSVSTDYLLGNDIGKAKTIDVSGLSDREIEAVKTIVDSLKAHPTDMS